MESQSARKGTIENDAGSEKILARPNNVSLSQSVDAPQWKGAASSISRERRESIAEDVVEDFSEAWEILADR